jgi:ATPase family associated with various cellular activities (AAA)
MTTPDHYTLTPRPLAEALTCMIRSRQTVCLWGEPGVSKSSIVAQVADQEGLSLIDLRMSTLDPTDLRGLPAISADRTQTTWISPDFLPRDGRGIIFFDEMNRAPQAQQNAALQLVLAPHTLGTYTLPRDWTIVAACNYESNGGGINRMNAALCNRFNTHLHVEVSLEDWSHWAARSGIEPVVIAFLRFRPEYLHCFDSNAKSFPTPRSWEFVSNICKQQPSPAVELALICGAVGRTAGIEFAAFLKLYRTLPSIDAILLNPAAAIVPTDVATQYAVAAALARKATGANLGRIVQYLDRLPVEFNVYAVRDAVTRENSLTSTPAFVQWAIAHQDVTIQ